MTTPPTKKSFYLGSWKAKMPIAFGALLIAQTLPLNHARAQVTEARPSEICTSPKFGGSSRNPTAEYSKCAGAPSAALAEGLSQTELFWVPTTLKQDQATKLCSPSGPLSATLPRGIKIFTLINIDPTRQLTARGTGNADVLVGSAGSSDNLIGSGGLDTYVVGGLQATLTVRAPDVAFPSSTVQEQDDLTLGGSTEYIHINPGIGGQNEPGSIQTPLSTTPSITPRGGSAVPIAKRPAASGSCQAFQPRWGEFKLAFNTQIASLASAAAERSRTLLAQPLQPHLRPSNPEDFQTNNSSNQGNPGAPTLRGFSITTPQADQIFVPAQNLLFEGKPINEAFPPGTPIPVLVVAGGVRFGPAKVLSQENLNSIQRRSQGLLNVRSQGIPLVYFRQNGLLVISQSNAPLGSSGNPGVVVAQLLDKNNKPLNLPLTNDGIYLSRFLTFTALPEKPSRP